ncbi:proline-rich protein 2-like [Sarcophilus harrisii]|uniref:proline-rich protein 2-like n=1 Tax=Sarcophilus harrisii TaxID=9305 RepID=UPI001301F16B|nr:proline-rich protein 2-like [Sarcophilus harrisii]
MALVPHLPGPPPPARDPPLFAAGPKPGGCGSPGEGGDPQGGRWRLERATQPPRRKIRVGEGGGPRQPVGKGPMVLSPPTGAEAGATGLGTGCRVREDEHGKAEPRQPRPPPPLTPPLPAEAAPGPGVNAPASGPPGWHAPAGPGSPRRGVPSLPPFPWARAAGVAGRRPPARWQGLPEAAHLLRQQSHRPRPGGGLPGRSTRGTGTTRPPGGAPHPGPVAAPPPRRCLRRGPYWRSTGGTTRALGPGPAWGAARVRGEQCATSAQPPAPPRRRAPAGPRPSQIPALRFSSIPPEAADQYRPRDRGHRPLGSTRVAEWEQEDLGRRSPPRLTEGGPGPARIDKPHRALQMPRPQFGGHRGASESREKAAAQRSGEKRVTQGAEITGQAAPSGEKRSCVGPPPCKGPWHPAKGPPVLPGPRPAGPRPCSGGPCSGAPAPGSGPRHPGGPPGPALGGPCSGPPAPAGGTLRAPACRPPSPSVGAPAPCVRGPRVLVGP